MSQGGYIGGWARMCNGRSAWYVNLLCCPFVMVYNSFWIYCFGCCLEYLIRLANTVGCFVCKLCCWWCCEHVDKAFPANASSIGPWKAKSKEQIEQEIEWKRATEVVDALGPQQPFSSGLNLAPQPLSKTLSAFLVLKTPNPVPPLLRVQCWRCHDLVMIPQGGT